MQHRYLLFALALLLSLGRVGFAQVHFNADERRIITLEDERRSADSVALYLTSSNTRTACRAAIALANIGDTFVRPTLSHYYHSERRDSVANAEAFALGLLGPNE